MKIIVKPRLGGKTTELIRLADKHNGYIICRDRNEAGRVANAASDMGHVINFPITFDEFQRTKYYAIGIRKIFIDNADLLIQSMTSVPIAAITVTGGAGD
jgi:hypothetical protein